MQARLIPFYASSFRCRYGALVAGQIRYPAVRAAIRSDNAALGLMVPLFLPLRIVLLRPHYQHAPSFSWFPPPSRFLLDRVPVGSESCTPSLHFFYTFRHRWSTPTPRDFTYASIGGGGGGGFDNALSRKWIRRDAFVLAGFQSVACFTFRERSLVLRLLTAFLLLLFRFPLLFLVGFKPCAKLSSIGGKYSGHFLVETS